MRMHEPKISAALRHVASKSKDLEQCDDGGKVVHLFRLETRQSPITTNPCRPVPATKSRALTHNGHQGTWAPRTRPGFHPESKPKPGSTILLECGVQVGGFGGQLGLFLVDSVTLVPEQSCRPPSGPDFLTSAKLSTCSHLSVLGWHIEEDVWVIVVMALHGRASRSSRRGFGASS